MLPEIYSSDTLTVLSTIADPARFEAEGCELVTFEPLTRIAGREPFGARFATRHGLNALHIVPVANDWYQYPDLDACLAVAARHVRSGATVYGSSAGAFAATTYADAFPGSKVIALSPQFSIRGDLVPFERRWRTEAARIRFRNDDDRVACVQPIYVLYDPANPDRIHAEMIAARADVRLVAVRGGGHPVGPVLVEAGCLSKVILAIMNGAPTPEALLDMIEPGLERSPTYFQVLATESPVGEREALLLKGLAIAPNNFRLRHHYGLYLSAMQRREEALPHLAYALSRRPHHPAYRQNYLRICAQIGVLPDEALLTRGHSSVALAVKDTGDAAG